jgi:hypothetical protein
MDVLRSSARRRERESLRLLPKAPQWGKKPASEALTCYREA